LAFNVAKKLECLGGTRSDDGRSLETVDDEAYFYSEHGRVALDFAMKSILRCIEPFVPSPRDYTGDFFEGMLNLRISIT